MEFVTVDSTATTGLATNSWQNTVRLVHRETNSVYDTYSRYRRCLAYRNLVNRRRLRDPFLPKNSNPLYGTIFSILKDLNVFPLVGLTALHSPTRLRSLTKIAENAEFAPDCSTRLGRLLSLRQFAQD